MKSLKIPMEPFELEVVPGIRVMARPVTTLDMSIIHAAAQRQLNELEEGMNTCFNAGIITAGQIIDLSDRDQRNGVLNYFVLRELANRHIISFISGVETEDGEVMPATPESKMAFADISPVGEEYLRKMTERNLEMILSKKESGVGANGISSLMPAPDIAPGAEETGCPAPMESRD